MRFIGSKTALVNEIENVINENTIGNEQIFCDLFSGTGTVARHFKSRYEIYSNDLLHFSYVIQKATIENNELPQFLKLKELGIVDPFSFLEETPIADCSYDEYFITQNYSPNKNCDRMYVSNKNATRIDFIRNTIEAWKQSSLINDTEYFYLLAGLIEGVPYVSNITGTYGAYLKEWDKRTYKEFEMRRLEVLDNKKNNRCFNTDGGKLIEELEGDILYLDPPYNSRQYAPNYHLLETISKYDYPTIKGVTGMRDYAEQKSLYCVKSEVLSAFDDLISKAKFTHIVVSYSSDGLMSAEQIEAVLKKHGISDTFKRYDIPYRKYKGKLSKQADTLYEYIFYIKKDFILENSDIISSFPNNTMVMQSKKYIKSPLNYIGGKYKLLPQIMPLFPPQINTLVDLFSGGANVGINTNANSIICNDINTKIIEMFTAFQQIDEQEIVFQIERNIKSFKLSKENQEGFLKFRDYYNNCPNPIDLYTLACYSFNYQFRFNNDLKYNNPFGKNRSQFSENMRTNLLLFVRKLKHTNIRFTNMDFARFDISNLGETDLVYCDPPYLITTGSYNDGNRGFKDWGENEETELYELLDKLNVQGVKFALSNVLTHKGKTNEILMNWSKKYKVVHLNFDYSNSSHNTVKGVSDEVLIINY
ncbi:Dam family site-specific DNA-(adenine-N6)-methyltransferase [Tannockella kyphosi]|uniref:Dam family site-specific DNA-(adenine-N6)-methyltransferase n=1 Tax=Tannockella kyphosi TaxID=2899121 RepID=UPI0020121246|nr:Dam family site-specific DNA-(adenine-N6)-methyltransferase [Tannockella kyphosi]